MDQAFTNVFDQKNGFCAGVTEHKTTIVSLRSKHDKLKLRSYRCLYLFKN